MMASAPGLRLRTQASNFSCRRRSAALEETKTVSMPNWRKHSVRRYRDDSLRSTRATRAVPFLVEGAGAKAVPKAFSIGIKAELQYESLFSRVVEEMQRTLRGKAEVTKVSLLGMDW